MATVTIKGFIHKSTGYGNGFHFFESEDMSKYDYVLVGPYELSYEVPENFSQVAAEVSTLYKALDRIAEEHTAKVRHLKGRIQELLCIENKPSEPA